MNKWLKGMLVVGFAATTQLPISAASATEASAEELTKQADWYLHMDVKALKNSVLGEQFIKEKTEGISFLNTIFSEDLINRINYLDIQGDVKEDEGKVVLIQGDFAGQHNKMTEKWQELGFNKSSEHLGKVIYQGTMEKLAFKVNEYHQKSKKENLKHEKVNIQIDDEDKNLNEILYSAFKSEQMIIVSDDLAKLKEWLADEKQLPLTKNRSVFEVVVDVEKSLLHGGVNVDEMNENFNFESISAKQISQVSASYSESNGYIDLQLGIKTSDAETATRIKSVANGLIALKILSESNRAVVNLLSSIQFEQDAGDLLVKLTGSVESFKTLVNQADSL